MGPNKTMEDRVCIVMHRHHSSDAPALPKSTFLVPKDTMIMHFISIIRKQMSIPATKALFVFTEDKRLLAASHTISSLIQNTDSEGKIHLTYAMENAFGSH